MKCSSLLLLAALSVADAAATEISKKCNTPGQVSLIVNSLTLQEGPKLLQALKQDGISALVVVPKALLQGEDNVKLVKSVKESGHELGFHYALGGDGAQLAGVTDQVLLSELKGVTERFAEVLGQKLTYVTFPYTENKFLEQRFARIATSAGLMAVGHSLYLSPKETEAKNAILNNVYDSKAVSYIALMEGTAGTQQSVIDTYMKAIANHHFSLVPITQCLSGTATPQTKTGAGSAPAAGAGIVTKTHQRHHNKHHGKHGKKHGRKHNKHGKKHGRKHGKILVNLEYVKGYKAFKAKADAVKGEKLDAPVDGLALITDAQKMQAQAKEIEMHKPKPITVEGAGQMNALKAGGGDNKDGDACPKAKKDAESAAAKKVDKADDDNAASHLTTGITTVAVAAVASLLVFL